MFNTRIITNTYLLSRFTPINQTGVSEFNPSLAKERFQTWFMWQTMTIDIVNSLVVPPH